MKRTWGFALLIAASAFAVGACAHIYDDGIGDGSRYDRVAITHPQNGAKLSAEELQIEGTSSESRVEIEVFDPYDRLVTSTRLQVRDGRWATSLDVRDGRYRIRATSARDRDVDEVRVTYRDDDLRDGEDWSDRRVAITSPENGASIRGSVLEVRGTSRVRSVRVQLFDDGGRMIGSVSPEIRNARWSTQFNVRSGRYWIRASGATGSDAHEVRIAYRGDLADGDGNEGPSEDRVAITYPQDGSIVNSGTLDIEGTSIDRNVRVQIYDVGGRVINDSSIDVHDGRWNTRLDVRNGRYRIAASTPGDRDEVRVTYRGEYGDYSPGR